MYMYAKQRKDAMWQISLAVSEYMVGDRTLSENSAIEKYLEEIHYPGMNAMYRRKFIKMSLTKYPPQIDHQKIKLLD